MSISLLLDMAVSGDPDREAVVDGGVRLTTADLSELADGGAGVIAGSGARHVVYVGTGGVLLPLLIFASARAGRAFTPLNYRLSDDGLRQLIERLPDPLIVTDSEYRDAVIDAGKQVMTSDEFTAAARTTDPVSEFADPDDVAIVLFTSGTTSRPKAVELSHNNLTSYITGTVDFGSADPGDAALVCVPPYHIAGVGAALSNVYAGRKIVYLCRFDPREWVELVRSERVTTATVVPTMLDRIVTVLESEPTELPTLRNLAYGGSKVGLPLVRKALDLLPEVGFVNAYGLTETSSTITVLTPEDHHVAHGSSDEAVARRLGSVGRPVPGIEIQIRAEDGTVLGPGETGELFVRGPQVSGKYAEIGSVLDAQGWFPTKDVATADEEGYLFIGGRSDDTIIRGGENIAPSEVEDVLIEHPDVHDVAVVGLEDPQWGQIIVAVVVPEPGSVHNAEALREYARKKLRGSRTPDRIVFRDHLPTTTTGKVVRREIVEDLKFATVDL
ncbi:class I adenylate-forming enzyme family protein [Mycolicibacter senuensis]|uniref:class I adenylate-forming enzyme family protein n=1 Tax=Mycolicibacter senuensis TaxID=386913 RepID=UPI000DCCB833|nr:fatty acid--CoA ligase family protein [Mycolicibacter senuensis]RAV02855.1 long-chain fatty acid--CoA ligase [Mycolicibacter senuensis]